MRKIHILAAALPVLASVALVNAAFTGSDPLTTDTSANYTVSEAQSNSPSFATNDGSSKYMFGFDYSTVGVPQDPNYTAGGTHALQIQAAYSSTSNGGISIAPTAYSLPSNGSGGFAPFKIQYDEWTNFDYNGTNSTTLDTVGVGTTGTTTQFTFNNAGTVMFGNTLDGGTGTSDYRAYVNSTYVLFSAPYNTATYAPIYGAYSVHHDTTTAILNNTYSATSLATGQAVAYYVNALTGGGTITEPAGEGPGNTSTGVAGGTLSTTTGTTSYAWHVVDVNFTGTDYIWTIDGAVMADIPASMISGSLNGSDFFIGGSDTGAGGNAGNAQADTYNFILVDNLAVTAVPEPTSISLLGLGALSVLTRRRK